MKIYSKNPEDWKDLQIKVGKYLSQLGYEVEIEKNISTVRETVNVDVYASNNKDAPYSKILCECKYWDSQVPKTIVHSFRTVVADYGANYGIIISKSGFQSGSHTAAKNTNIFLLDWEEFQNYFKEKWILKKQFSVSRITRPLLDYVSAGFSVYFKKEYQSLSQTEMECFKNLNSKYFDVAFNSSNIKYQAPDNEEFDILFFKALIEDMEKKYGLKFISYEEYYDFLVDKSIEGTKEFDDLFKSQLRLKIT